MYQKANLRISKNATLDVFRSELRKIYEVVNEARSNEAELKKKLFKREHEVEELAARLKHDPRVAKVLFLAHRWRQEKAEAEEIGNEYLTELNSIRTDIRTMETNLN
uniref:Uncharacterized protein n=1 Tax=Biomphalaria glabrata TaxID=6526 RepID=A0A2C9M878_BIOGL